MLPVQDDTSWMSEMTQGLVTCYAAMPFADHLVCLKGSGSHLTAEELPHITLGDYSFFVFVVSFGRTAMVLRAPDNIEALSDIVNNYFKIFWPFSRRASVEYYNKEFAEKCKRITMNRSQVSNKSQSPNPNFFGCSPFSHCSFMMEISDLARLFSLDILPKCGYILHILMATIPSTYHTLSTY